MSNLSQLFPEFKKINLKKFKPLEATRDYLVVHKDIPDKHKVVAGQEINLLFATGSYNQMKTFKKKCLVFEIDKACGGQ